MKINWLKNCREISNLCLSRYASCPHFGKTKIIGKDFSLKYFLFFFYVIEFQRVYAGAHSISQEIKMYMQRIFLKTSPLINYFDLLFLKTPFFQLFASATYRPVFSLFEMHMRTPRHKLFLTSLL